MRLDGWSLKKYGLTEWTGFIWLRVLSMSSSYEHGNEKTGNLLIERLLISEKNSVPKSW